MGMVELFRLLFDFYETTWHGIHRFNKRGWTQTRVLSQRWSIGCWLGLDRTSQLTKEETGRRFLKFEILRGTRE